MWLWVRAVIYMVLVGGGWLVVLPAGILRWESPGAPELRPWFCVVAGVLLALRAGYCLICYGGGTPLPLDPPRRLVTEGPYRFVRNPQAVAMSIMATGELLVVQSALLLLMLPLTLLYLEALVGPIEARQMTRDFGEAYQAHSACVPKWLPGLRGQTDAA